MGTICAMTTCLVEAKACPTRASSRTFRVAALALPLKVCFLRRSFRCICLYSITVQPEARVTRKEWGESSPELQLRACGRRLLVFQLAGAHGQDLFLLIAHDGHLYQMSPVITNGLHPVALGGHLLRLHSDHNIPSFQTRP